MSTIFITLLRFILANYNNNCFTLQISYLGISLRSSWTYYRLVTSWTRGATSCIVTPRNLPSSHSIGVVGRHQHFVKANRGTYRQRNMIRPTLTYVQPCPTPQNEAVCPERSTKANSKSWQSTANQWATLTSYTDVPAKPYAPAKDCLGFKEETPSGSTLAKLDSPFPVTTPLSTAVPKESRQIQNLDSQPTSVSKLSAH